jgi:hypothetical protein
VYFNGLVFCGLAGGEDEVSSMISAIMHVNEQNKAKQSERWHLEMNDSVGSSNERTYSLVDGAE